MVPATPSSERKVSPRERASGTQARNGTSEFGELAEVGVVAGAHANAAAVADPVAEPAVAVRRDAVLPRARLVGLVLVAAAVSDAVLAEVVAILVPILAIRVLGGPLAAELTRGA